MGKTLLLFFGLLTLSCWATPGEHLKAGTKLPEIREADQTGAVRTLDQLKGPKGTLLVVFRSADW